MRLIILLFVLIVLVSCTHNRKSLGCSRFRNGRFLINQRLTETTYEIDRKEARQTEHNRATDSITGYDVKWTSACEYELLRTYKTKKTTTDSNQVQHIVEYRDEAPLKVKITATGDDFYVFESRIENFGVVYRDTMWVLK